MKIKKIANIIDEHTNVKLLEHKRIIDVRESEECSIQIEIPEGRVNLTRYFESAGLDVNCINEEDFEVKYIDSLLWCGKIFEIPLVYGERNVIRINVEAEQKRDRRGKKLIDEIDTKLVLVIKSLI